ncbi:hypothetical protein Pst134EA_024145 [Puccinia striiformis f. sp. tritici]|uniref:hypothetical protein n=1 Tax=Puccinia striiformis f. sp. tritici TaxID=168172 RepID=UPI0020080FD2|nr:hypothetical protein Pst134EA_024145 [Puccinia striiformis f. sp. tritici]KAH9444566.1 hypothetical protein Pst134EB_024828 [Puccinia striiformis f. sp. tritici]KAH9453260.1 hypothetical protein Pst134EA_024145 [Puccinia striiformis f. sp. tritici]
MPFRNFEPIGSPATLRMPFSTRENSADRPIDEKLLVQLIMSFITPTDSGSHPSSHIFLLQVAVCVPPSSYLLLQLISDRKQEEHIRCLRSSFPCTRTIYL